jgi:hypothetical protein
MNSPINQKHKVIYTYGEDEITILLKVSVRNFSSTCVGKKHLAALVVQAYSKGNP